MKAFVVLTFCTPYVLCSQQSVLNHSMSAARMNLYSDVPLQLSTELYRCGMEQWLLARQLSLMVAAAADGECSHIQ